MILHFLTERSYCGGRAITQLCPVKMIFLTISQNSQNNTCSRVSFLIKLQASGFYGDDVISTFYVNLNFNWCLFVIILFKFGHLLSQSLRNHFLYMYLLPNLVVISLIEVEMITLTLHQFLLKILGKAELIVSIRHIEKFSNSGIPIYNSKVPEKSRKEMKRKGNCKVIGFKSNAIIQRWLFLEMHSFIRTSLWKCLMTMCLPSNVQVNLGIFLD